MTQRLAYAYASCVNCGRICDEVSVDDRCTDCGPLPLTPEERAALEADTERARKRREDQWGISTTAKPIPNQ